MALKDLDTFFDPDLHLPILGKSYRIAAPAWEYAKHLRAIVGNDGLPPVEQIDEALTVLGAHPETGELDDLPTGEWSGGAFTDMVADGVPWPMILHAGRTAIIHFGFNPDMAEIHWAMAHLGKLVDLEAVTEQLAQLKKK